MVDIKPVKGFFGGPRAKITHDVFDDLGMDDGGLFVLTVMNKRKQRF